MVYTVFCVIHIAVMVGLVILFCLSLLVPQSVAKNSLIILLVSIFITITGMYLELTMSETVSSALVALKIEYIGLFMMMLSLMHFVSIMANFRINIIFYIIVYVVMAVCIIALFSTSPIEGENHGLFYRSMEIISEGAYKRIEVKSGIGWIVIYSVIAIEFVVLIICTTIAALKANPIQQRRIRLVLFGLLFVVFELILKGVFKVFGSYNPFAFAVFVLMIFLFVAIFKYGYFNSAMVASRNVLDHSEDGILTIDEHGRLIFANSTFKRIMPQVLVLKRIYDDKIINEMIFGSRSKITIDGIYYEVRKEEIRELDTLGGYVLWFVNITKYQENLAEVNASNEAKSRFLAQMSHEIRTPINTMLSMNEMIRRVSRDGDVLKYSRNIEDAGKTLMVIVNDILDISKVETGKVSIISAEYSVKSLFSEIWVMTESNAKNKNITLEFDISPEIPSVLYGDKVRIKQVLLNLVINAIKYTDEGGVLVKASAENDATLKNTLLTVLVADTGSGIKPEDMSRIFEIFERVEYNADGAGIGLSIAKRFSKLMGGDVSVESTVGKGSTFTFTLLQEICDFNPIGDFEGSEQELSEKDRGTFFIPDANILEVDDNQMNRFVVGELLKRTHARVDFAESGAKALEMVKLKRYDVILMDMMMPKMDGVETLYALKALKDTPCEDTPVVAVTANAVIGMKEKYISLGFSDYISKPINPDELERVIKKFVPDKTEAFGEKFDEKVLDINLGLLYSDNDSSLYRCLVEMFCDELLTIKQQLADALEQNDTALYRTIVHGFKNNARSIGGTLAADVAYELEEFAAEGSTENLFQNQARLFYEMDRLNQSLEQFKSHI